MVDTEKYVIWAREAPPPSDTPVLLWNSFGFERQHPSSISLPKYVEENAEEIRRRILDFLCEVKLIPIDATSLETALLTPEGLSSWWLSFPSLKQWGKRLSIPTACRLVAISMICGSPSPNGIRIESDKRDLKNLISRAMGGKKNTNYRASQFLKRNFVHPMRAIGSYYRYVWHTSKVSGPNFAQNRERQVQFAIFDYLTENIESALEERGFRSSYWGNLPQIIEDQDWFHIYPRNANRIGLQRAELDIDQINRSSTARHQMFLTKLNRQDSKKIWRSYRSQRQVHRRSRHQLARFRSDESSPFLWNVFEDEWNDSIVGSTAIRHLILLTTTDNLVRSMPKYLKIFFLMENQPWEFALAFCVRRHSKGQLIGVAHSTIRFWDLRYFLAPPENGLLNSTSTRPHPDQILVNSEIGKQLLVDNSFPANSVAVVEALRYAYLLGIQRSSVAPPGHILILGDFLEQANTVLMTVVHDAIQIVGKHPPIKIRNHPICQLTKTQLGYLADSVSSQDLSELLGQASLVITTAASSSAAESIFLGIPTIIVLNPNSLNYSPFRNPGVVQMVENSSQLAKIIVDITSIQTHPTESLFCLDPNYSRWKKQLSLS